MLGHKTEILAVDHIHEVGPGHRKRKLIKSLASLQGTQLDEQQLLMETATTA
jgi:hypothetical protein